MKEWSKEQIQKEIEEMDSYLPVNKIEERLGMPPTTLQKVLAGKRNLPKKWIKILEAYFIAKPKFVSVGKEESQSAAKHTKESEIKRPFMSDKIKKKLGIK